VAQAAGQHPGDDLGVRVRVGVVAGPRRDDVVVVRDEHPEPDVGRVVVDPEGERVPRRQALAGRGEPVPGPSYGDHAAILAQAALDRAA
jgi:hypothetical protein